MASRDKVGITLMTYRNVNLQCDNDRLRLRYRITEDNPYGVWFCNGKNTGLQFSGLLKVLREKYKSIKVTWKRQF